MPVTAAGDATDYTVEIDGVHYGPFACAQAAIDWARTHIAGRRAVVEPIHVVPPAARYIRGE